SHASSPTDRASLGSGPRAAAAREARCRPGSPAPCASPSRPSGTSPRRSASPARARRPSPRPGLPGRPSARVARPPPCRTLPQRRPRTHGAPPRTRARSSGTQTPPRRVTSGEARRRDAGERVGGDPVPALRCRGRPLARRGANLCTMASLLMRNAVAAAVKSVSFLNCCSAPRLFSSWLLGRSSLGSPSLALTATKLHRVDLQPFLADLPPVNLQPVAGMKCKVVLRRRCKDCFFVRRRGNLFILCKTHPRHKQRKLGGLRSKEDPDRRSLIDQLRKKFR
uniref:Ribosomal protein n=1 Tax=Varanus komodoensis TaxID=61221 RepID=A0A8D2J222_VARKO